MQVSDPRQTIESAEEQAGRTAPAAASRRLRAGFRLDPILAALLVVSAAAAHASTAPTSTDEARAIAGRASLSHTSSAVTLSSRAPSSTDEARAIAGRVQFAPARPSALATVRFPTSTDEARAMNAVRAAATESKGAQRTAVACHGDCSCRRG